MTTLSAELIAKIRAALVWKAEAARDADDLDGWSEGVYECPNEMACADLTDSERATFDAYTASVNRTVPLEVLDLFAEVESEVFGRVITE